MMWKKRKSFNLLLQMLSFTFVFGLITFNALALENLPLITNDEQLEQVDDEQLGSITSELPIV